MTYTIDNSYTIVSKDTHLEFLEFMRRRAAGFPNLLYPPRMCAFYNKLIGTSIEVVYDNETLREAEAILVKLHGCDPSVQQILLKGWLIDYISSSEVSTSMSFRPHGSNEQTNTFIKIVPKPY